MKYQFLDICYVIKQDYLKAKEVTVAKSYILGKYVSDFIVYAGMQ